MPPRVDGSAFGAGFDSEPVEGDAFSQFMADEAADEPGIDGAPAEPVAPAVPIETDGEPETVVAQDDWPLEDDQIVGGDEPTVPVPVEETTETEPAPLLAGRFETPEQLEQSYRSLQGAYTQDHERTLSLERQLQAEAAERQRMQGEMDQMREFLLNQTAANDPEFAAQLEQRRAMDRAVDERVAATVAAEVNPLRERLQQTEVSRRFMDATTAFYAAHPDIAPRSPEDQRVAQSAAQLLQQGVPLDMGNPQHIEIAFEAAQDPQLAFEIINNPRAVQMPDGVELLKHRVASRAAPPADQPGVRPSSPRTPPRRRVDALVESGGSGAPVSAAPGTRPNADEFDEAMAAFRSEPVEGGLLFGSRR